MSVESKTRRPLVPPESSSVPVPACIPQLHHRHSEAPRGHRTVGHLEPKTVCLEGGNVAVQVPDQVRSWKALLSSSFPEMNTEC